MGFADIKGNQAAVKALRSMADTGRVAHSMLFYENEGCGALPLIIAFCQYLYCPHKADGDSCGVCPTCRKIARLIHPDIRFVFPVNSGSKISSSEKPTSESYVQYWRSLVESNPYFTENELYEALGIEGKAGNISVLEAKGIMEHLSLSSVEGGYKTVVMWLPEKMNAEAANKLLKSVEEPPANTLFLFVTHAPEKVLQTIFSRCQSIRVLPSSVDEVCEVLQSRFDMPHEEAVQAARLSGGSVGRALYQVADHHDRDAFLEIFVKLVEGIMEKDLMSVLDAGEAMATLDSREKQKAFCVYASDGLRKIFMLRQNLASIAGVRKDEEDFFNAAARGCSDSFCIRGSAFIDSAYGLIERNVNAKIVFCDLVNRMFLSK